MIYLFIFFVIAAIYDIHRERRVRDQELLDQIRTGIPEKAYKMQRQGRYWRRVVQDREV